jgi:hypothetical protein
MTSADPPPVPGVNVAVADAVKNAWSIQLTLAWSVMFAILLPLDYRQLRQAPGAASSPM